MSARRTRGAALSRREFHREAAGALALTALGSTAIAIDNPPSRPAPAVVTSEAARPHITCGVSSGDVTPTTAVLWSRSDRPARMVVELSLDDSFKRTRRVLGPETGPQRDFTAKVEVRKLEPGREWFYRVRFQDLDDRRIFSEAQTGRFRTASDRAADVRFLWSADTAGQGYGIDPARGGMTMYRTMANLQPDFFVHTGDNIYADNPFPETLPLEDGSEWRNLVTPETAKVAETLDEFHANYRYNFLDEHFRAFHASTSTIAVWDDHETLNNWYPGEQLDGDDRYRVKSVSLLASRARAAFFDYLPIRESATAPGRIYRSLSRGPGLELFCLDMRSYRGPNTSLAADGVLLGRTQLDWLKRRLAASRATWKVVCSDMPIGLIVSDGREGVEAVAQSDGPSMGREGEIAELLRHLRDQRVDNVIWLTGDVHYAASHHYDPSRAIFQDFDPFWEFVSGPIHAGTFGPGRLDNTFGPEVRFRSIPEGMRPNRPPSEGLQFCGEVKLDGASGVLTVTHLDVSGRRLWSIDLPPRQRDA
jgi:alkaline phosphatase D